MTAKEWKIKKQDEKKIEIEDLVDKMIEKGGPRIG